MDQAKVTKFIKEHKPQLRQLTSLNNEVRELKGRVDKLETKGNIRMEIDERFKRIGIITEEEIANIKIGGTD